MAYRDTVLTDSPIDYYEMETSTGTDSGSGGRTLTLNGGVTTGVAGKIGNAWQFDGVNDYASMASWYNPSPNFTFEAWIKAPSAQGMTGDYHTIVRRDGTDIILLRVRGSNVTGNVNPGQLEAYVDGTTLVSGSSFRVDDGNWHHVAVTVAGSACTLYVDGVSRATATAGQTTWNMGTGTAYIGAASGTSEFFKGYMDEVALYNTALSSTRIAAHYNTGVGSIQVDVATATATADVIPFSVAGQPTDVAVDVATATATAQTQDVKRNVLSASRDVGGVDEANTPAAASATAYLYDAGGAIYDFEIPADFTDAGLVSATLYLYKVDLGGTPLKAEKVTAEWADSDITHSYGASVTGGTMTSATGWKSIDVTSLISKTGFYGLKMTMPGSSTPIGFSTNEGTQPSYLVLDYVVIPVSDTVDVITATISTLANDVTISVNVQTDAETATSTLQTQDVTVEANTSPDVTIDVDTLTVSVQTQDVVVGLPTAVDVDTVTATAQAEDVTVEVTQGVDFTFDTPSVTLNAIKPTDINGEPIADTEEEDRYFVSTMLNLDEGDVWWRLDERSGTEVKNRANPTIPSPGSGTGVYHNVTIGLNEGIDGRHSVQFNGTGYITENESTLPGNNEQFTIPSSLEFTFRTERATQFLMGGADAIKPAGAGSPTEVGGSEFWLQDGKINFRAYSLNQGNAFGTQPPISTNIVGFKNLADGEWHHIVVNMGGLNSARGGRYLEIWVDGFLEIRRFAGVTGTGPNETVETSNIYFGMPDWIGGRPANSFDQWRFFPAMPIAQANYFLGDMTEIIFRNGQLLSEDYILLQDDMMFGRDPIYPETARLSIKSYDATAKGNKKRMLVIDMADGLGTEGSSNDIVVNSGPIVDVWGNVIAASSAGQFHFTGPGNNMGRGLQDSDDLYGYQVFKVHARNNYLDNVTDNERVLDLDIDLNMDDYDVISVVDYPHTDAAWAWFDLLDSYATPPFITGRRQVEHLVNQIREQVVNGKSLFISDPDLALAIGVIDRYEFVPLLREHDYTGNQLGANVGYYDFQAATEDPWSANFGSSDPHIGAGYEDHHANDRQRVRALVPGLTDIPGYITTDFIAQYNRDPMATPPYQETFKYASRDNGLTVGDEFYMLGANGPSELDLTAEILGKDRTSARLTGWLATPPGHVVAGKMVTSFSDKVYNFDRVENNPYRDYASSIVVEPGDEIKGQTIVGKIYVNFTEAWTEWAPMLEAKNIQVIPPNSELPAFFQQTDEQRKWSWSTHRGDWTGTSYQQGAPPQIIINPDGTISADGNNKSSNGVVRFNWAGWFPVVAVDVPSMAYRGFKWLAEIDDNLDGSAIVGVETATVQAQTGGDSTEVQKGSTVELSTLRITAEAYNDLDTEATDVDVLVSTAGLTAFAGSFIEIVDLSTAQITTRAYDDLDVGFADDNVLVLTLPFHNLTLYMEER